MTNSDNGGLLAQEIILTIAREYGWPGPKPTEKVPVTLDRDALEGVTGTYQVPEFNVQVTIALHNGTLIATLGGGESDELVPESETSFFRRRIGDTLQFELENERARALLFGSIRAERID